jgi:tRNA A-37 threonylcarbamoyl transferase component Bud32
VSESPPDETIDRADRAPALETTDPLVGRVLDDRFHLRARLGQGGMGAVYLADQPSVGREVAVKVIQGARLGADLAEARSRFIREGRLTARLSSPHIVTVIDAGDTPDGLLYLVMERLHGRGLDRVIAEEAPLPAARAVHLCSQIAFALAAAHRAGVIHRDLKPSNVMLLAEPADRDHLKVLDFGIARSLARDHTTLTPQGDLFGTPAYVSPEMARGALCGPRSDLYALGLVAYELLAGRRPFPPAATALAAALQHLTETPAPLPESVPPALARVVMRLLAREPEDRHPSAEAAQAALTAAVEGQLEVGPDASAPPPVRSARWRLALFIGSAAVAAAIAAGLSAARSSGASADAATTAVPAPRPDPEANAAANPSTPAAPPGSALRAADGRTERTAAPGLRPLEPVPEPAPRRTPTPARGRARHGALVRVAAGRGFHPPDAGLGPLSSGLTARRRPRCPPRR